MLGLPSNKALSKHLIIYLHLFLLESCFLNLYIVRSPRPSKIFKSQSNTLFAGEVLLLQYVIKMQTSLLQIIVKMSTLIKTFWGFKL